MNVYRRRQRRHWTPSGRPNLIDSQEYESQSQLRAWLCVILLIGSAVYLQVTMGCAGALDAPITAANAGLKLMEEVGPIIHYECVAERERENDECVKELADAAEVGLEKVQASSAWCDEVRAERDRFCEPVTRYYKMVRLSHATLVAAIQAVEADRGNPAEVITRASELAVAVRLLGEALAAKEGEK